MKVINLHESYKEDRHFRIQSLDIDEYLGNSQCIKIHLLLKNLGIETDGKLDKWSEQYALSCASSVFEDVGYELRYYRSYYGHNEDKCFANKVDALFESIRIDE